MTSRSVLTMAEYGCVAVIAAEFYLLPILIGWARRVPRLRAVAVIDITLGWTVIGWIVAVTMALRSGTRARASRSLLDEGGRMAVESVGVLRQPGAAPPLVLPDSRPEPGQPR